MLGHIAVDICRQYYRRGTDRQGKKVPSPCLNGKFHCCTHKHCGKVWLLTGCVTLSLSYISLIVMLLTLSKCIPTIGLYGGIVCGIQLVILIASIFPTEVALKKKFDSDRQN